MSECQRSLHYYLITGLLLLTGCQAKPTRVVETQKREFVQIVQKAHQPIEITDQTMILDVRSAFDYGLGRVQSSIHFPWENLSDSKTSTEISKDLRKVVQRLSLIGLTPASPTLIVGYGTAGNGEEGRLAWSLIYLGMQDVQVSSIDAFRKTMTQIPTAPLENKPVWTPEVKEDLRITKSEFLKWAHQPKQRLANRIHILDVRSSAEYLNRPEVVGREPGQPDVNAINIEWKEFYTGQGRPNAKFKNKLLAFGIRPEDQIILISNRGVRSSSAAYALISMGFQNVRNFLGGWNSTLENN